MYLGSWKIDDYVLIPVDTHRLDTGEVTDADSNPTYKVYEDETASAIVSGTMAKLSDTGHYTDRLQLLSTSGFEQGKNYHVRVEAIVNSATAALTRTFQIRSEVNTAESVSANNLSEVAVSADCVVALSDYGVQTSALATTQYNSILTEINEVASEVLSASIDGGVDVETTLLRMLSYISGRITYSSAVNTFTYYRQDNTTSAFALSGTNVDRTRI